MISMGKEVTCLLQALSLYKNFKSIANRILQKIFILLVTSYSIPKLF